MNTKGRKKSTTAETHTPSDLQAAMDSAMGLGSELKQTLDEARTALEQMQAARKRSGATPGPAAMGDTVLFRANKGGKVVELAAQVSWVVDDGQGRVNLTVHDQNGTTFPFHDAHYSEAPKENTWRWR